MHLSELAARHPDKPAVIMADGSGTLTFADLDRHSCRVSRLLAGLGVGPGDHVAVLMANRLEYFAIAWGAQRRGTYWTPVNWHLTADEAGYIVADCGGGRPARTGPFTSTARRSSGGTGSGRLAADLMLHCRSRLASFKCPRSVEFTAALPRTPTGKLLRRRLREERQRS